MKKPFEKINGGRIGFDGPKAMRAELKRCGWSMRDYLRERDKRIAAGAIK